MLFWPPRNSFSSTSFSWFPSLFIFISLVDLCVRCWGPQGRHGRPWPSALSPLVISSTPMPPITACTHYSYFWDLWICLTVSSVTSGLTCPQFTEVSLQIWWHHRAFSCGQSQNSENSPLMMLPLISNQWPSLATRSFKCPHTLLSICMATTLILLTPYPPSHSAHWSFPFIQSINSFTYLWGPGYMPEESLKFRCNNDIPWPQTLWRFSVALG